MEVQTIQQPKVTPAEMLDHLDGTTPVAVINGVVELGQGAEPSPMEWLVKGIIPEGHATILSGDGGLGKSYVAEYLALCVVRGEPFFGRPVKRGNVLWVDAEGMGQDEVERRLFQIARGIQLDRTDWRLLLLRAETGSQRRDGTGEIRDAFAATT